MLDELDLAAIEARLPDIQWNQNGAWLYNRLNACLAEIHRLRTLLTAEREHTAALRERLHIIRRYIDDLPQE